MFDQLLANVDSYIHTNPWLAVLAVFCGGALTATYPCVLAMIPLMMSYVAGSGDRKIGPARAFGYSLVFVLGLAITFVILGMTAALAGSLYGDVSDIWKWIVAVVCLVMGLHLLGVLDFAIPGLTRFQPRTRGVVGALCLGLLFGFVSAPCAAPILVVVLTYIAGSDTSVVFGGLLLLVYALGHSLLSLVAGTSMGLARRLIESQSLARANILMRRIAGVLIILIGVYFAVYGIPSS